MGFELTQEQRLLAQSMAQFVERELLPYEDQAEQTGEVPSDLGAQIRDKALQAGFYALNMPESVGGPGLDYVTQAVLEQELGRVSWSIQSYVRRPSNILLACQGEQREKYLYPSVRGEKYDCFALTEPSAGSDANDIKTTAKRDGDSFVINGSKHFISHAGHADFIIVFAVTSSSEQNGRKRNNATAFLIDRGHPGLTIKRGPICVSNRGYHTYELYFDGCRVSEGNVLGEVDRGWELAGAWLKWGRLKISANCVGQARRALDHSVRWAKDRRQFGRSIGEFQGISFKIADMATEIEAAEALTLLMAARMDRGEATDAEVSMAKLFSTEMLGRVVDEAVQIFGGMGLMHEAHIERMWRNARIERIWEGTSEIQRHIISRKLLKA